MENRRQFLKTAGALILGGVAPAIVGATDKAGTKPPIIGEGDFQFECIHNWGEIPDHITLRNTHGVAVDKEGFVYLTHQGDARAPCDTVIVFDPAGQFVRSFGSEYAGGGHGIDIRNEGGTEYLYLSDIGDRQVIKCDKQGEWVWKKRYPREPDLYDNVGQFRPTNVSFGADGEFYVADGYGSNFIHQYKQDGTWIRSWGGTGNQAGKLKTPHGLWLDDRTGRVPRIVVTDRANSRLQYFSVDGKPIEILQGGKNEEIGAALGDEDGEAVPVRPLPGLSFPADIDTWDSFMIVADLHARLLLLDKHNLPIARIGYDEEWTEQVLQEPKIRQQPNRWPAGKFVHPHDACFDIDGNILVTEWVEPGRITMLSWL